MLEMDRLKNHMHFVDVVKLLTKAPIGLDTPRVPSHQHIQESTWTNHLMLYKRAANGLHPIEHQELKQATKLCKKGGLKMTEVI